MSCKKASSHSPISINGEEFRVRLKEKKGQIFEQCASLDQKYICCHFHVIHSLSNCPFNCSYCFLQNYLTNKELSVIKDTDAILKEIKEKTVVTPWYLYRIGNWELGDSLALNPRTKQTNALIEGLSNFPNILFELRTKSDYVDEILALNHKQRTIVSWTMSPEIVIKKEEHGTATLSQRLKAIQKVLKAGYLISLHFDPMLYFEGWEKAYFELIAQIFKVIPATKIAWISIGSLRFNPEMKKTIEENFPHSKITTPEMISGDDRKMRYVKPLRIKMYQLLYQQIKKHAPKVWTYLCMERFDVWDKIFGTHPESIQKHDYLIATSLHQRFPHLITQKPSWAKYQKIII
jgi:spore photoproduct lyase